MKRFLPENFLFVFLLLFSTAVIGCVQSFADITILENITNEDANKHVVILKSSSNPMFQMPIDSFVAQVEEKITIVTLPADADLEELSKKVAQLAPDALFALGNQATILVNQYLPDVPAVFSMVPDYQALHVMDRDNIYGISLESQPVSDFVHFKMVIPNLTRVLVFYKSNESEKMIQKASSELRLLDIELVPVKIDNLEQLQQQYTRNRSKVEGVWLHTDPVVMNRPAFEFIKTVTLRDKIPLLASLSEQFTREGAVASVSLDFASIGSQAANAIQSILQQHEIPPDGKIQPPVGGKLTVNLKTAKLLGIEISADIMPYITKIYGENTP